MVIVLLNQKKRRVHIYTKRGTQTLNFSNIEMLDEIIGNEEVFYVTQVINVSTSDIIETVKKLNEQMLNDLSVSNEPLYLHVTVKGSLNIPNLMNMKTEEVNELTLRGPTGSYSLDRLYDTYGKNVFDKYPAFKSLLRSGKLEIITQSELKDVKKEAKIVEESKQESESILVDSSESGSAAAYASNISSLSGPKTQADRLVSEATDIDLDRGGNYRQPRGGVGSNEGSLLPEALWEDYD